LVKEIIEAYIMMGCSMSLKIHFLRSHLDFFPRNLGDISNRHGERFHQGISGMEKQRQWERNQTVLTGCCWQLKREVPDTKKRKASGRDFKLIKWKCVFFIYITQWKHTRVKAGSNTSTVTLRVVGGDEKGSLKSETVKYGRESQGTRSRE
jgi:hypothetical protein